jgi:hypothetical protein
LVDDAVGQLTAAIAEHDALTHPDPAHGGGMETLVAVDDGNAAHLRHVIDVEQWIGHPA